MKLMTNKMKKYKSQNGSALLVALIFLGVLTMVGVSVTLTSTSQLKIAANGENLSDTFHATNAGMNLLLAQTAVKGKIAFNQDALLLGKSQSGAEHEVSTDFLTAEVYNKTHGVGDPPTGALYGNQDGTSGKVINISVKQKAKGTICPRSENGSSLTKISCDHFDLSSKYTVESYEPAVKVGVYREMVHSNSASHQQLNVSDTEATTGS